MMRHMAKVWMRTCVFIACGLRSVHGARTRWTLLAPSVGWGWQGLLCTVLCGLEDVSKFTGICHSRRCLTHSVRCHCHALYDHPERNVLKILKIANKEILRTDGKTDVLMTCVALSQKNNDKWSYLPQLKKMKQIFCFILCCEVSWGCSFWFFGFFLKSIFLFLEWCLLFADQKKKNWTVMLYHYTGSEFPDHWGPNPSKAFQLNLNHVQRYYSWGNN